MAPSWRRAAAVVAACEHPGVLGASALATAAAAPAAPVLGLLSASAYGSGDFFAGMASRRYPAVLVTTAAQVFGCLAAIAALFLFASHAPHTRELAWGALSGVGSTVGTFSLYRGLAVGRMSVVATVSAVLTAVIPVLTGLALGNQLSLHAAVGIGIAVPAIAFVSWTRDPTEAASPADTGARYGVVAGLGFALLFIALDRAGTRAGAWPLVPGQAVSILLLAPFALRVRRTAGRPTRDATLLIVSGGILSAIGNLLFLAATGHGALAIVAVLTALYPAVTVVLARVILGERWTATQAVGLVSAAAAIVLVSL